MTSYTAAAQFYRLVREFAQRQPEWAERIVHDVTPDEALSIPLISYREYGNFNEHFAVMAAAGLDSVEQELVTGTRLILPTARQLENFKNLAGFVNDKYSRDPEADPLTAR